VFVYHCVGPPKGRLCVTATDYHCRTCRIEIGAKLAPASAAQDGAGYVDTRIDWSEIIDFNKAIG
jgi:hypothetical protein